jgi:hypothetical protein
MTFEDKILQGLPEEALSFADWADLGRSAMVVQSVVVKKGPGMTEEAARKIARDIGHDKKIDTTEDSWRFRQREPEDFQPESFRVKKINASTSIIIGRLK